MYPKVHKTFRNLQTNGRMLKDSNLGELCPPGSSAHKGAKKVHGRTQGNCRQAPAEEKEIQKQKEYIEKVKKLNKEKNSDDNYFAAFSGQDVNLSNKKFNGSDVTACFGGIKLDLREAIIEKDIVINASSIFGGINILVPEDVNVIVKSTSIFGGVTNKKENTNSKKNIYINAMCMFGGVDIK